MMTQGTDRYLSDHFSRIGGGRRCKHRLDALRANYFVTLPIDRKANILEIGPGLGEFLELTVNELAYGNVNAIDTSREVVDHCNKIFGNTTHIEDPVAFLLGKPGHFDRIFMLHVLEHVPKPTIVPLLAAIRGALRPGTGAAVIEVPNMANPLTGSMYRYADFTHEIGFTASSLAQALRMADFNEVEVRRFVTPVRTPLRLLQRLGKWAVESCMYLLLHLYQQKPEIVSANLIAVARRSRE